MTTLTVRAQGARPIVIGVRFNGQGCSRLACPSRPKMRQHPAQQVLHLKQFVGLPTMLGMGISVADFIVGVIDIPDASQVVDTLNSIEVNRGYGQPDDTLVGRNIDTSFALKDPNEPAKFQIIHNHYGTSSYCNNSSDPRQERS